MTTYHRRRLGGIAWVLASASGFGCLGIFAKFAYADGASTVTLLFLRFFIAGTLLAGLMLQRRLPWPQGRDLRLLIALGALAYVGQSFCFFSALRYASAGLVALLLYLYPAFVTLAAAALGRQRLTAFKAGAVVVTLGGVFLTLRGALDGAPLGIAFGIGAALIYTVYILVGERVTARTGSIPAATVIMLAAAVVYGCATLFTGPQWPTTVIGWGAVAGIALLSTVLAMVGFFAGMQRLGAADAATFSTLEPVVTLALAALLLNESLDPQQLTGAALILLAVVALARAR